MSSVSALELLQPLTAASKRQQGAVDGWAHVMRSDPTARAQLEAALRPLLTEEASSCTWLYSRAPYSSCRVIESLQIPHVFSLEFFTPEFCGMLVEQLDAHNATHMHISRPNTQNDLGNILSELGLGRLCDGIVADVLQPLGALLYEAHGGASLNSNHSFTVVYRPEDFKGLPMHYDRGSNITLNVSIGKVFTGGSLTFCGVRDAANYTKVAGKCTHRVGRALLHLGFHRHGPLPPPPHPHPSPSYSPPQHPAPVDLLSHPEIPSDS
jgi:hypothetical protein